MEITQQVRAFIATNFYVPESVPIGDDASLIEQGIIDSTGVLEVIGFIEDTFGITVDDKEMIPENLDSIDRISGFIRRKKS